VFVHDMTTEAYLKGWSSMGFYGHHQSEGTFLANAAPEWQAEGWGGVAEDLAAACPLEGLVRPDGAVSESSFPSMWRLWDDGAIATP
jgi:hypothetical protein